MWDGSSPSAFVATREAKEETVVGEFCAPRTQSVLDELAWLRRCLARAVFSFRARDEATARSTRAMVVLDDEIDAFLRREPARLGDTVDAIPPGVFGPVAALGRRFGLSSRESNVLLLCVAHEIETGFSRTYAYLQDDLTRPLPCIALALDCFADSAEDRLRMRGELNANAALFELGLVEARGSRVELQTPLSVNAHALRAILTPRAELCARASAPELILARETRDALCEARQALTQAMLEGAPGVLIRIIGKSGDGRGTLASSLTGGECWVCPPDATSELLTRQLLTAALDQRVPCLSFAHVEQALASRLWLSVRRDLVRAGHRAVVVVQGAEYSPLEPVPGFTALELTIAPLTTQERQAAWREFLGARAIAPEALGAVAGAFPMGVARIRAAALDAKATAARAQRCITLDDLESAARARSGAPATRAHSSAAGRRISLEDVVLPAPSRARLAQLLAMFRQRSTVLESWALGKVLRRRRGICALFSGPSGTGKTTAANAVASELGLELLSVDLAAVVSKYIGETEKNLALLFERAHEGNRLLFFDEAEALWGRRSEVKTAHDRYANIEVAYLLQRIESFEGMTILATNLAAQLDAAFLRRIDVTVDFPLPQLVQRKELWSSLLAGAPTDDSVDREFLAHTFELAGGDIRNVVFSAASSAAEGARKITMLDLVRSTQRELSKRGRTCSKADFGAYASLLEVSE